MFQFRRFPSCTYVFSTGWQDISPAGLLHSDTHGSKSAYDSPWLFAVSCVLHRLLMPRHSPCALCSLTIFGSLCVLLIIFYIKRLIYSTFASYYCSYKTFKYIIIIFEFLHFLTLFSFQGTISPIIKDRKLILIISTMNTNFHSLT